MGSNVLCPSCKSEVMLGDKFCRSCGTRLSWSVSASEQSAPAQDTTTSQATEPQSPALCPLCGHENSSHSHYCESCGNRLATSPEQEQNAPAQPVHGNAPQESGALKTSQSWKLTISIAALFIIAIVVFLMIEDKTGAPAKVVPVLPRQQQQQPPQLSEEVMHQLQELEKAATQNPDDKTAALRYANALQDTRHFALAMVEYKRYLKLDPKNPDAIVDLGVTYFELSRLDSLQHQEYLTLAQQQMNEALQYNPKHQLALFNLGIVHLHLGDMDQAHKWFERCAEVDSTTDPGRKAKMLIQQHTFTNPS